MKKKGNLISPGRVRTIRGFTLIEALASIVVLSIIGTIASSITADATDGYIQSSLQSVLEADVSEAMTRIHSELILIPSTSGTGGGGSPTINRVNNARIRWKNQSGDNVELSKQGKRLELKVNNLSATLLDGVTEFDIRCFDEQNKSLGRSLQGTKCQVVRRIEIRLTAERSGVSSTLRTRAFVRSTRLLPKP